MVGKMVEELEDTLFASDDPAAAEAGSGRGIAELMSKTAGPLYSDAIATPKLRNRLSYLDKQPHLELLSPFDPTVAPSLTTDSDLDDDQETAEGGNMVEHSPLRRQRPRASSRANPAPLCELAASTMTRSASLSSAASQQSSVHSAHSFSSSCSSAGASRSTLSSKDCSPITPFNHQHTAINQLPPPIAVQHTSSLLHQKVAGISNIAHSKGKASVDEQQDGTWPGFRGDSALELAMPVPLTPSTSFEIRQSEVDGSAPIPSRVARASAPRHQLSPIRTQQAKQLRPKLLSPKRSVLDRHRAREPSMQSSSHSISSVVLDSQPAPKYAGRQAAPADGSDSLSTTSVPFAETTAFDPPNQWVTPVRERQRLRKHSARNLYSPVRQIALPEQPPSRGSISISSTDHRSFPLPYIPSSSIDADSDARSAQRASHLKAVSSPRVDIRRGSATSEYVSAQEEVSVPQMRASKGLDASGVHRQTVSTVHSLPIKSKLVPAPQPTIGAMEGDHLGEWLVMVQPAAEGDARDLPSPGTMILPLRPSRSQQQLCLAEELGEDEHFSRGIQFVLKPEGMPGDFPGLILTASSWSVVFGPYGRVSPDEASFAPHAQHGLILHPLCKTTRLPIAAKLEYSLPPTRMLAPAQQRHITESLLELNHCEAQNSFEGREDFVTPPSSIHRHGHSLARPAEHIIDEISHLDSSSDSAVHRWIESTTDAMSSDEDYADDSASAYSLRHGFNMLKIEQLHDEERTPQCGTASTSTHLGTSHLPNALDARSLIQSPMSTCEDALSSDVKILHGQRWLIPRKPVPVMTPSPREQSDEVLATRRRAISELPSLRPPIHSYQSPSWRDAFTEALQNVYNELDDQLRAVAGTPSSMMTAGGCPSAVTLPGLFYDSWAEEQDVEVDGSLGTPAPPAISLQDAGQSVVRLKTPSEQPLLQAALGTSSAQRSSSLETLVESVQPGSEAHGQPEPTLAATHVTARTPLSAIILTPVRRCSSDLLAQTSWHFMPRPSQSHLDLQAYLAGRLQGHKHDDSISSDENAKGLGISGIEFAAPSRFPGRARGATWSFPPMKASVAKAHLVPAIPLSNPSITVSGDSSPALSLPSLDGASPRTRISTSFPAAVNVTERTFNSPSH